MTAPAAESVFLQFVRKYRNDVVLMVREVFGVGPDIWDATGRQISGIFPDQIEMLLAYQNGERRISKRSGHRVGKTTTLAWIQIHHMLTKFPQKTVCTAPTSKQLFDALYAETVTWMRKLPAPLQSLFEIKSESIVLRAAPTESFISYRTSSPDTPEALAGVHSDHVLIICDEASGIPEVIYEAAIGSMAGANACTILAGNPVRTSGLFFDTHNKPEVMPNWVRLHASCEGHPNVTPDFMKQVADTYGIDSNAYRVRVLGEFPKGEANTVIPWELIESSFKRDVKPLQVVPIWGLDVGLSQDPCALAKRQGNCLMEKTKEFRADDDLMRVVAWVKGEWDTTLPSQRPSEINVDYIGMGPGVVHRLVELNIPARGVNVSEAAAMNEQFVRLRSELWWKGREWFAKRDSNLADDEKLGAELARPTYAPTSNGKILVEGKRETKKRTRTLSPNRADAFLLTLASEAITASGTETTPRSWKKPLEREIKGLV